MVPPKDAFTYEQTKSKTHISNDIKIWYKKNYKFFMMAVMSYWMKLIMKVVCLFKIPILD
jgi:hypothetical protein